MSVLYSVILLDAELVTLGRDWLTEQNVPIPVSLQPSRWPTLGEVRKVLTSFADYQVRYGGGLMEISNGNCHQVIYSLEPYPTKDNDLFEFFLRGYCEEIVTPLLQNLSPVCGVMVIVKNENGQITFVTSE